MTATANGGAVGADRFRLRRSDFSHRNNPYVDAGWWPRSLDLAAEVEQLAGDADRAGFPVVRILYGLDDSWTAPPRQMVVAGRKIKLSGYHNQRKAIITLVGDSGRNRLEVMVVPPGTDAAVAQRALGIAGLDGDDTRGEDILARAEQG